MLEPHWFMSPKGSSRMFSAREIVELHDYGLRAWHQSEPVDPGQTLPFVGGPAQPESTNPIHANGVPRPEAEADFLTAVARQHRANFDLWHIEDEARTPGATDSQLAAVKRRIDPTNQRRNDLAEQLDRFLLEWLMPRGLPNAAAPLHSESPGLIIDRLSILALKIYHTGEEAERAAAPPGHAQRNRDRLAILEEQRADLAQCLQELWRETLAGTRRFKIYRQLKMYNDPSLNPAIYRQVTGAAGR
jgi:hypothetical protein